MLTFGVYAYLTLIFMLAWRNAFSHGYDYGVNALLYTAITTREWHRHRFSHVSHHDTRVFPMSLIGRWHALWRYSLVLKTRSSLHRKGDNVTR